MKNIVVIEDDKDVVDVIRYFLEKEQYRVHVAQDGVSGIELATRVVPSLILLDLMLPQMNGIEVCQKLKADGRLSNVPIIMVTAKGEVMDKVRGLEIGADDYVTKPFSPHELIARVKANLRKREGKMPEQEMHYGSVFVDAFKHEVHLDGKEVELTAKEFDLLVFLIENQGRVLTRHMILNHVWGYNYFGTTRTVDVHVTHLRHKLPPLADAILTVKPLGYKLKELVPQHSS